jgi:hypothetical protein
MDRGDRFVQLLSGSTMAVGGLTMLAGPGVLLYQIVLWLRDGVWTPLQVRLVWQELEWPEPAFEWLGVQRIANGMLDLPFSLGIFLVGIGIVIVGAKMEKL